MSIDEQLHELVMGGLGSGLYETVIYMVYRDAFAKPGSIAIDIGAHKGLHTYRLAECVGPAGKVYAFEPLPELASALDAEIASRYPDGRVLLHQMAVSRESGELTFYRNTEAKSQSTLIAGHAPNGAERELLTVQVTTLDECIPDEAKFVSVIKIDAEGAEFDILAGARNLLGRAAPLLILEFSPDQMFALGLTPKDFFDQADDLGYAFYNIDGTRFDLDFVKSGKTMHCYERFGAKKGHWTDGFLQKNLAAIVQRHIDHRAAS